MNHALYGRTLGHYSIAEITQRFPGLVNESFVFSFARNPYSRILSSYHFAKAGKTNDMGISRPEQYQTQEFASFDRFLNEWLVRQDLAEVDFVFQPQCNFVCIDGELALDFLGNVESLDEDIQLIEEKLGRSPRRWTEERGRRLQSSRVGESSHVRHARHDHLAILERLRAVGIQRVHQLTTTVR